MSVTTNTTTGTGSSSAMYLATTTVTSGTLMNMTQGTSTFSGTGLIMNFGATAGSFTGNFADMQVNGTSKITISRGTTTASGSTAIAGLFEDLTLTNGTVSGFQFGNRLVATVNGATAGTEVGQFIRMIDNTTLDSGQTVRGLEVQAFSGTNVNGINTGIASYGYTFGIQGTTTAQGASQATPAAVYADLDNGTDATTKTRGNAIRAYTNDATSATLVQFYQETSAFTGAGLQMDFGNSGGTYAGNFIDLKVNGTSKFTITENGTTTIASSDLGNGTAGPVITVGRNSNGTNTGAGSINLLSKAGTAGYIWQDAAGNVRINTSAPSNANDTSGTVLGAQTSTRETKQDIEEYTDFGAALQMVADAPLHSFRYIKDVEGYGKDSPLAKSRIGYIADEVPGLFMWGNTIDQVSVNGILMASVKELNNQVKDLQMTTPTLGQEKIVMKEQLYLSEDSVGQVKILAGSKLAHVTFNKPYEFQPIPTVTPIGINRTFYGVDNITTSGFDVIIDDELSTDIIFNWHAFAGEQAKLFVSDGSVQSITVNLQIQPIVENINSDSDTGPSEDESSNSNNSTEEFNSDQLEENNTTDNIEESVEPDITSDQSSDQSSGVGNDQEVLAN